MNLADLLHELRRNILRDVSTAIASPTEEQTLWDDVSLIRYINEGYFRFCRRSLCLRDSATLSVTQITLQEGEDSYPLDPSVLAVYSVTHADGTPVTLNTHPSITFMPAHVVRATGLAPQWAPGKPLFYTLDDQISTLRLLPAPSAEQDGLTVHLRVARTPLARLEADTDEPEIDEDYHLDILEWAAFRALRNHDVDAENMNKASAHKKRFEDAVEEIKKDARTQMFEPVLFEPQARWD